MADQITIANMALSSIGARSSISSLTEGSTESNAVSLWYDPVRRDMLRAVHWNFAKRVVNLSLLGIGTTSTNGIIDGGCIPPWMYEYAYPSDCMKARRILPNYQMSPAGVPPISLSKPPPFDEQIDQDVNGNDVKVILCNYPQAQLVYTRDVTNTQIFDDSFVIGFANMLGARMCNDINGDKAMAKDAMTVAQQTIATARATNGNEGIEVLDQTPDWMRVRGYASDYCGVNSYDDPGFYGGGFGATFVD